MSAPHTVQRYLQAAAAIEAVQGVYLAPAERVFLARIRLWSTPLSTTGVAKVLTMAAEHRLEFERLVYSRTGKAVSEYEPALPPVVAPAPPADPDQVTHG